LADVEALILKWRDEKKMPVAAVIIEPIMSEGGDNLISGEFANGLRRLTKSLDVRLIVDEV